MIGASGRMEIQKQNILSFKINSWYRNTTNLLVYSCHRVLTKDTYEYQNGRHHTTIGYSAVSCGIVK